MKSRMKRALVAVDAMPLVQAWQRITHLQTHVHVWSTVLHILPVKTLGGVCYRCREVARLAIGGLDLPPALGRRGLDGLLGWEGNPEEELRWALLLLLLLLALLLLAAAGPLVARLRGARC